MAWRQAGNLISASGGPGVYLICQPPPPSFPLPQIGRFELLRSYSEVIENVLRSYFELF